MPANASAALVRGPAFGTTRPTAPAEASCGRSAMPRPSTRTTRKTCWWWPVKSEDVCAPACSARSNASAHTTTNVRAIFTGRGYPVAPEEYLYEWEENRGAEGACDTERPARGGGEEDDLADSRGAVGREPRDAGDPEHEADCGLDGVEGDPGGEAVGEGDALGLEGEGDGAARDADVAGGEGDHPGDLEGGDDHDRGGEGVVEP